MSSRILLGLKGNSRTCTPRALDTALDKAAPVATMPISPAPLTPSGLRGEGAKSRIAISKSGTSMLVGSK